MKKIGDDSSKKKPSSEDQLRAFFDENYPELVRIARRFTRDTDSARDLVQDAALKALQAIHRFEGDKIAHWMRRIMRNAWYDAYRKRCGDSDRRRTGRDALNALYLRPTDVPDNAELALSLSEVLALLDTLSRRDRSVILSVTQGTSYAETAKIHRMPLGTVKSSVTRIRGKLAAAAL